MAKLTKEQRAGQDLLLQVEAAIAHEKYKVELPKRLMDAQALAITLNVSVRVGLTVAGPVVSFKYENSHNSKYIDCALTYESDEYAVICLENQLVELKKHLEQISEEIACAQSIMNNLTDEQRELIKKHIHLIR